MKLYKLTDNRGQTHNSTQWGEGVSHSGTGEGGLCGPGWIHAYRSPLLAVFMNPTHANFKNPLLWEAEGKVAIDDKLKVGCRTLTTIKKIDLPRVTTKQRIAFGILVTKEVYKEKEWNKWADKWLSGEDRSYKSAYAAIVLGNAAAYAAVHAAVAADVVAYAAVHAAEAVAVAANTTDISYETIVLILEKVRLEKKKLGL